MGENTTGGDDVTGGLSTRQEGENRLPEVVDADYVYDALVHPRRRYLCYALLTDAAETLPDLATQVAAWEHDIPEPDVTDEQHERAYVSLYHAHVPKLVANGVVEFDEERETVTPGQNAGRVLRALESVGASLDDDRGTHARSKMDDERE